MNAESSKPVNRSVALEKCSFTWERKFSPILDFFLNRRSHHLVTERSDLFSQKNGSVEWQLRMDTRMTTYKTSKLFLMLKNSPTIGILLSYKVIVTDMDKSILLESPAKYLKIKRRQDIVLVPILQIPEDGVIVTIYVSAILYPELWCVEEERVKQSTLYINGCYELHQMVKTKKFSDLCLTADGGQVRTQRVLLASKSDYFRCKLKSSIPSRDGFFYMKIHDLQVSTLEFLVNFLFDTDGPSFSPLTERALRRVCAASKKYGVKYLYDSVCKYLYHNLRFENAVKNLLWADEFGLRSLKIDIVDFISGNIENFERAEMYRDLQNRPDLLTEILAKVT